MATSSQLHSNPTTSNRLDHNNNDNESENGSAPDSLSSPSALGQRRSGRYQRRAARQQQQLQHSDRNADDEQVQPQHNTCIQSTSKNNTTILGTESDCQQQPATTTSPTSSTRRGPSEELEQRIAASIAKRTQTNVAAATLWDHEQQTDSSSNTTNVVGTYEYLDHTADIQIHSWGDTLEQALEQLVLAMFGYMTPLALVEINDHESDTYGSRVEAQGHDVPSLVFAVLQEWLYVFHTSRFVPRHVHMELLDLDLDVDNNSCRSLSSGRGECMKLEKHLQGTEVKAVTYSNLQVLQQDDDSSSNDDNASSTNQKGKWDIWVILDI